MKNRKKMKRRRIIAGAIVLAVLCQNLATVWADELSDTISVQDVVSVQEENQQQEATETSAETEAETDPWEAEEETEETEIPDAWETEDRDSMTSRVVVDQGDLYLDQFVPDAVDYGVFVEDNAGNHIDLEDYIFNLGTSYTMHARFIVDREVTSDVVYTYQLPQVLVDRSGALEQLTYNNGNTVLNVGTCHLDEDGFLNVVFTEDAADYLSTLGNSIEFYYTCEEQLNRELAEGKEQIEVSIPIDGGTVSKVIQNASEESQPYLAGKSSVNYSTGMSYILWNIAYNPGAGTTFKDVWISDDFTGSYHQTIKTGNGFLICEGNSSKLLKTISANSSEYQMKIDEDGKENGFYLHIPEEYRGIELNIKYYTELSDLTEYASKEAATLTVENEAVLVEADETGMYTDEAICDKVEASGTWKFEGINKEYIGGDKENLNWRISVLPQSRTSQRKLPQGSKVVDVLPEGLGLAAVDGVKTSDGGTILQDTPDASGIYYTYNENTRRLEIVFEQGIEKFLTFHVKTRVVDESALNGEIVNTASLAIPGVDESNYPTAEAQMDGYSITNIFEGYNRQEQLFRWKIRINGNGIPLDNIWITSMPDRFQTFERYEVTENTKGNVEDPSLLTRAPVEITNKKGKKGTGIYLGNITGEVELVVYTRLIETYHNWESVFIIQKEAGIYSGPEEIIRESDAKGEAVGTSSIDNRYLKKSFISYDGSNPFKDLKLNQAVWRIRAHKEAEHLTNPITIVDTLGAGQFIDPEDFQCIIKAYSSNNNLVGTYVWPEDKEQAKEDGLIVAFSTDKREITLRIPGSETIKGDKIHYCDIYYVTNLTDEFLRSENNQIENQAVYSAANLGSKEYEVVASGTVIKKDLNQTAEYEQEHSTANWQVVINQCKKQTGFGDTDQIEFVNVIKNGLDLTGIENISFLNEAGEKVKDVVIRYESLGDGSGDHKLTITFPGSELKGQSLTLKYSTVVKIHGTYSNTVKVKVNGLDWTDILEDQEFSKKGSGAGTEIKAGLTITKIDGDTLEVIKGAAFKLYRFDNLNTLAARGITDSNGKLTFENLDYNMEYVVIEEPVKGYFGCDSSYTTADGSIIPHAMGITAGQVEGFTVPNYRLFGGFDIKKVRSGTTKVLPGAKFEIRDSKNHKVDFVNDGQTNTYNYSRTLTDTVLTSGADGMIQIRKLPLGTYTLIETEAPSGYKASQERWTIKVEEENFPGENRVNVVLQDQQGNNLNNGAIVVENTELISESKDISFRKTDTTCKRELQGAHLKVYARGDPKQIIDEWISGNNEEVIHRIPVSSLSAEVEYVLEETKAPDGYRLAENIVFKIRENGTPEILTGEELVDGVIVMIDETIIQPIDPVEPGQKPSEPVDGNQTDCEMITIRKTNMAGTSDMRGSHLKLYVKGKPDEVVDTWVSGEAGESAHVVSGSKLKRETEYVIEETFALKGYIYAENILLKVDEDGKTQVLPGGSRDSSGAILMKSTPVEVGIARKDSNGRVLAGVTLTIYERDVNAPDEKGEQVTHWTTSEEEEIHVIRALLYLNDEYVLEQTYGLKGYEDTKDIIFKIASDGTVVMINGRNLDGDATIVVKNSFD